MLDIGKGEETNSNFTFALSPSKQPNSSTCFCNFFGLYWPKVTAAFCNTFSALQKAHSESAEFCAISVAAGSCLGLDSGPCFLN